MNVREFVEKYALEPERIDADACMAELLVQMGLGLEGKGDLPMIPSYLSLDTVPQAEVPCCIMDAGGTNLRTAKALFREDGSCELSGVSRQTMLGSGKALSYREFYGELAELARKTGCPERIGLCFSYNVEQERTLDGRLLGWCKEIRVPEAVGKPVGASLMQAVGPECCSVHVLNDSVAALLGAHYRNRDVTLGVILGTGINICYSEACSRIPKVPGDLRGESMIISTEIGEFRGIPKTVFDEAVIAASDEPALAQAEKQCAGAYLGQNLSCVWKKAAQEGVLEPVFCRDVTLPEVSDWLAGAEETLPDCPDAKEIARLVIARAAKIAAILTAGVIVFSHARGSRCTMVIEGSQYGKLTGFAAGYEEELKALLKPYGISFAVSLQENSCLTGAALAAFAEPM